MRRLALRQKAQLSRMRLAQRNAQRDIEEKTDATLDLRPQFCLLCRLNYRQEKVKHQMSEAHRNMKKFLMPFCSVCQISFKSPMMYEAHRCSLDHIMVSLSSPNIKFTVILIFFFLYYRKNHVVILLVMMKKLMKFKILTWIIL